MTERTYKCAQCGKKCISDWEDEEAIAEYERDFGRFDRDAVVEICDDCYRKWKE